MSPSGYTEPLEIKTPPPDLNSNRHLPCNFCFHLYCVCVPLGPQSFAHISHGVIYNLKVATFILFLWHLCVVFSPSTQPPILSEDVTVGVCAWLAYLCEGRSFMPGACGFCFLAPPAAQCLRCEATHSAVTYSSSCTHLASLEFDKGQSMREIHQRLCNSRSVSMLWSSERCPGGQTVGEPALHISGRIGVACARSAGRRQHLPFVLCANRSAAQEFTYCMAAHAGPSPQTPVTRR